MADPHSNAFRLHVLGAPDLRTPDGRRVTSVLSQPKRLGLLTYLALAPEPVTRASLVALFWPESDEARARNALSQAVFYLRRSLDEQVIQGYEGDRLWAPPEHLWCDAREREATGVAAPAEGTATGTTAPHTGELLDGWNADDSQGLQEWLDAQRRRIREQTPSALAAPNARGAAAAPAPSATPPPAAPAPAATHAPAAPAHAPAPASPSSGRARPILARAARLLAVAALAVLVGVVLTLSLLGDRAQGVEAPASSSLAVLLPDVSAAPGAPTIDAAAVHAELLAAMPHVEGVRIVSANYAGSLQEFRRQLAALGVDAAETPRWILEVSMRVTDSEARAIGLLHRSPAFDLPGRVSFDVTYASAEAALLEAPQEVAGGIARMVAEVLSGEGR